MVLAPLSRQPAADAVRARCLPRPPAGGQSVRARAQGSRPVLLSHCGGGWAVLDCAGATWSWSVISVPVAQLGTGGAGVRGLVSSSHLEHSSPLQQQCDVGTDSQQDCAGDQPRLIQGIRRRDGIGEDQDTIASIRY